jgi:hypothetical protein
MKARLEINVPAEYHLRDGTPDDIAKRVEDLLPHKFHSLVSCTQHLLPLELDNMTT